ncbi:MAG: YceK/YidQ family lipoprotein [bacterium]
MIAEKLQEIMTVRQTTMLLLLIGGALLLTGCGTIVARNSHPCGSNPYYPATQWDVMTIRSGGGLFVGPPGGSPGVPHVVGWLLIVPLHILDLPVSLATDTICLPSDCYYHAKFRRDAQRAARSQAVIAVLASKIRKSPVTVLDEGLHVCSEPDTVRAVDESLRDSNTVYSSNILDRVYLEAPSHRLAVLSNPNCSTYLLVTSFENAYTNYYACASEFVLEAIVRNPNCPLELLEKAFVRRDAGGPWHDKNLIENRKKR